MYYRCEFFLYIYVPTLAHGCPLIRRGDYYELDSALWRSTVTRSVSEARRFGISLALASDYLKRGLCAKVTLSPKAYQDGVTGCYPLNRRLRRGTLLESMDCCHLLTICLQLLRAIVDLGTTPLFSLRQIVHKSGAV